MSYTLKEKYEFINKEIINYPSTDPIEIIKKIMHQDFINMHGPEHHYLDGAALLVSYYHAEKNIDLQFCLDMLADRAIQMPGAMCGHWGVCGSSASIGAAMSIIHQTSPLSNDDFYKDHMALTSMIIAREGQIGGPRCCKRNAYIALSSAVEFLKQKYQIDMKSSNIQCEFSMFNKQCLGKKCPFHTKK